MSPEVPEIPDLPNVVADLLERHGERWFKFVLRMVGNQDDAQDVLQEAVRRVLLRKKPLGSQEEVRMYLARAICNTAIEMYHLRKRDRRRHLPLRECQLPATQGRDPHVSLLDREHSEETDLILDLLKQGLAHLPLKQYEAVRLTLLEPETTSIRDVGVENGIPYSTLRHRSVQGIRKLKKFLKRALRSKGGKFVLI